MPRYKVENNLNLIIISNVPQPLVFDPTDKSYVEEENPWFVPDLSHVKPETFPLRREEVARMVEGAPNFVREFLIPHYDELVATKGLASSRFTIPCPITEEERQMFSDDSSEWVVWSKNILHRIVESRPGEIAVTWGMVQAVREGLDFKTCPSQLTSLQVIRSLIKTGYLAKERKTPTKTTKGNGYKILMLPEADEDIPPTQQKPPF
jgi:hypothetical protein